MPAQPHALPVRHPARRASDSDSSAPPLHPPPPARLHSPPEGDLLNQIHTQGAIEAQEYRDENVVLVANVPAELAARLLPFRTDETGRAEFVGDEWADIGRGRHRARGDVSEKGGG